MACIGFPPPSCLAWPCRAAIAHRPQWPNAPRAPRRPPVTHLARRGSTRPAAYPSGLPGTPADTRRLWRSTDVRERTASDVLRNQQPLETATTGELQAMVRGGDAFRDAASAMVERQLDGDDLVDVLAMHHAVHWALINRDRVRRSTPGDPDAIASSSLLAEPQSSDNAAPGVRRRRAPAHGDPEPELRDPAAGRGRRRSCSATPTGSSPTSNDVTASTRAKSTPTASRPWRAAPRGTAESARGGQRIRLASSQAHSPVSRPMPVSALRQAPSDSGAIGRRVSSGATVASATPRQP